jgi:hypothetical protein
MASPVRDTTLGQWLSELAPEQCIREAQEIARLAIGWVRRSVGMSVLVEYEPDRIATKQRHVVDHERASSYRAKPIEVSGIDMR